LKTHLDPNRDRPARVGLTLNILLAVLSSATLSSCAKDPTQEVASSERVLVVSTLTAASQDGHAIERRYLGQVEARRRSQVGFDLPGSLVRVRFDEGAEVGRGQLLAELDSSRLDARLRQLDAAIVEAQARTNLAASTLERIRRAAERDAISEQEVDEARESLAAMEATLARATAERDGLQVDIDKSKIYAPYRSVIARRMADEGQVLATGSPLFELVEYDRPRVRLGVPPDVADELAESGTAAVSIGDRVFDAKLISTRPEQSSATRTVDLLFELATDLGAVRVGETATIDLMREVEGAGFWLPVSALTESSRGLWSCLVPVPLEDGGGEATHRLEKRQLEVLTLAGRDQESDELGSRAFVRGALSEGEPVVAGGLQRLVPGQRVRLGDTSTLSAGAGS
jgi:RND family efflux transporter MFP subunit